MDDSNGLYNVVGMTLHETIVDYKSSYCGYHIKKDMLIFMKNEGYWFEMGSVTGSLILSIDIYRINDALYSLKNESLKPVSNSMSTLEPSLYKFIRSEKLRKIL